MAAFVPAERPRFCVHPSRLMRPASLSDITGVVGTSFYTTSTGEIGRSTLLAWLDGMITTYEAATHGSNALKRLGVTYPPDAVQVKQGKQDFRPCRPK